MMINIGTVIIWCILSVFIGFNLGMWKGSKDFKHHLDDMKEFYYKLTESLVNELREYRERDKKEGAE